MRESRRVVLVVESPFSVRDGERFGVVALREAGLAVEVWEVAPLTLPRAEEQDVARASQVRIERMRTFDELRRGCAGLTAQDVVISLLGRRGASLQRCLPVLRELGSAASLWCAVSGRASIEERLPDVHNRAFEGRRPGPVLALLRADVLLRTLARRLVGQCHALLGRGRPSGLRPLDIAWVATSARELDRALIGPTTVVRPVHAMDLDRLEDVLGAGGATGPSRSPAIVYVDGLGPLHPDIGTLDLRLPLPTMSDYFGRLVDAFAWIERATGCPVVIAAHPRAPRDGSLERWYDGRDVRYASTAGLIAGARLVLMSHPSDAVAMVLALNKPVIVLRSRRQEAYEAALCRGLARLLSAAEVWSERPPRRFSWPEVDAHRYARLRSLYLRRPDAPSAPYWQVVAADLREEPWGRIRQDGT